MPRYRAQINSTDLPDDTSTYEFIFNGFEEDAILIAKGHFFKNSWIAEFSHWSISKQMDDSINWTAIEDTSVTT